MRNQLILSLFGIFIIQYLTKEISSSETTVTPTDTEQIVLTRRIHSLPRNWCRFWWKNCYSQSKVKPAHFSVSRFAGSFFRLLERLNLNG